MTKKIALATYLVLAQGVLYSQVNLTSIGYYQSFDTLHAVGTAGNIVPWTDNGTLPGWYAYHGRQSASYTPGTPPSYIIDNGTSSLAGWGLRSYGTLSGAASDSDRALGELSSTIATIPFMFAVRLANSTATPRGSFAVSYWGEQWKQNTGADTLICEYSLDAASILDGTWTLFSPLHFPPVKVGGVTPLDGNASGNRTFIAGTITDTVRKGGEIWIRWTKKGLFSCGLGIDEFSVSSDSVTAAEPASQPSNPVFSEVTQTSMTVAFSASVPPVGGYLVLRKAGSVSTGVPVDYTVYSIGDTVGDGTVVFKGDGTSFAQSGLESGIEYYFSVFAYGGSAIVANYLADNPLVGSQSTLPRLASIASDVVAVGGSEAAGVSSLINDPSPLSSGTGVQVWQVRFRDGGAAGDDDSKPTIVRAITFSHGPANTVSNWSGILAADLFDGATRLASGVVDSQSVAFSGTVISVPDNDSITIALRISLWNSGVTDREAFQFALSPQQIVTENDTTSSQMAAFPAFSSDSNANVIQVNATTLTFLQQPTGTRVGMPMDPAVVAGATDSNGNTDLDYVIDISLTADGATLFQSPISATPVLGVAIFDSLLFTTVGNSVTLTASSGTWSVTSSVFRIVEQRTFYVDSFSGDDAADGLSSTSAWRSLTRVNATVFQPGDSLLFRSGATWTGMLNPQGSGDSAASIVIDRYGGTENPVVNGNGGTGYGALYLYNQHYWEVNNLEITNDAPVEGDRRGVYIVFSNFGLARHIHLKNLYIHNVKGMIGGELIHKKTAGIGIETDDDGVVPTRVDDILIEGCTISYVENTGLYTSNLAYPTVYPRTSQWTARRFTNVVIRGNTIHHISKNAMILRFLEGGLVEHNVCYETATGTTGNTMFTTVCDGTVFQYNEGYYNRASLQGGDFGDGSMYDADLRSMNITFQYSYSHDNSHGLLWTCTEQPDSNIVCRYNVSKNDQGIIFCISFPVTSVYIYNNTIYCGLSTSPRIISERNVNPGTRTYHFHNNIVYNMSTTAQSYDFRSANYTRVIDYNLYYGFHPANEPTDVHKLTIDPNFASIATDFSTGLTSVAGFALHQTSPAINAGMDIPGRPDKDYLGNTVPYAGVVDLGAFEYQQITGIEEETHLVPAVTELLPNYPNPFNPSTIIEFTVENTGIATIEVYSILGARVATIFRGLATAGKVHRVTFEASSLPAGVYFSQLTCGSKTTAKKMLLLK